MSLRDAASEAADVTRAGFNRKVDFLDDRKADEQPARLVPLDRDCLDGAVDGSEEGKLLGTAI